MYGVSLYITCVAACYLPTVHLPTEQKGREKPETSWDLCTPPLTGRAGSWVEREVPLYPLPRQATKQAGKADRQTGGVGAAHHHQWRHRRGCLHACVRAAAAAAAALPACGAGRCAEHVCGCVCTYVLRTCIPTYLGTYQRLSPIATATAAASTAAAAEREADNGQLDFAASLSLSLCHSFRFVLPDTQAPTREAVCACVCVCLPACLPASRAPLARSPRHEVPPGC